MRVLGTVWLVVCLLIAGTTRADIVFTQPHDGTGTLIISSYWDPDGSNYDEFVWDGFMLTTSASISEIRWRGGGSVVNEFEIAICASIPAGTQPDVVAAPLVHRMTGNNAGQTPAGTFGGVPMYDYHYVLPQPFAAAANTRYWVQIIAWTPSWPSWGLARGGGGTHFGRVPAVTGDYRFVIAPGDAAMTLVGTVTGCTSPAVTQHPAARATCPGATVTFGAGASGSPTVAYRWRKDGVPMNNGAGAGGSLISGATGAVLTIQGVTGADAAVYTCVATNGCGSATTNGAALTVCPSDFDCSGGVDGDDVIAFFAAWDSGDIGADITLDGGVDGDDVISFFAMWDTGC